MHSLTIEHIASKKAPIGIVGLGYVGLPLACMFAERFRVVGFDVKERRVEELKKGHDRTREIEASSKLLNPDLKYTCRAEDLAECPVIIVAVPTPVDSFKKPDLTPVIRASETVAKVMRPGTVVVFESTVYPGCTETVCREVIEANCPLKLNQDYFLGYSPERVNPGDKLHTIESIVKVVSGSTPQVCEFLAELYGSVIRAGVHKAANIATAEAAKVIENTQRDINIALVNELSMLFDRIGLDTQDVLAAARTKWNFLDFRPGLVGGHCIGVDPYYLTHLAAGLNFHPQAILAGRRINDGMGEFIAEKALRLVLSAKGRNAGSTINVGILGATFKENVPDIRNTRVVDIASALEKFGATSHLFDPIADAEEFHEEYHRSLVTWDDLPTCDALVVAVRHNIFEKEYPLERLATKLGRSKIVVDVKGYLSRTKAESMGVTLWRL